MFAGGGERVDMTGGARNGLRDHAAAAIE
jgi:hypothetical protein